MDAARGINASGAVLDSKSRIPVERNNGQDAAESLAREVDEEARRTTYPLTFPVLPEIPGGRYIDPTFYELELEHVWKKTWLFAGHASDIPDSGDYMLFDKIGLSILIVRQPWRRDRRLPKHLAPSRGIPRHRAGRKCQTTDLPLSCLDIQPRWRTQGRSERVRLRVPHLARELRLLIHPIGKGAAEPVRRNRMAHVHRDLTERAIG